MVNFKYKILAILLTANVASVLSVPVSVPLDGALSGPEGLGTRTVTTGMVEVSPVSLQCATSGSVPINTNARGVDICNSESQKNAGTSTSSAEESPLRGPSEVAQQRPKTDPTNYRAMAFGQVGNALRDYRAGTARVLPTFLEKQMRTNSANGRSNLRESQTP
ncbi:hypothetical protein F5878DRAFT_666206 [Lentinula raphanica]|uniref:Uncharacterized protein n=1 Tax=Lentinula raphanica TaxID=153919 RepID=A0AA38NY84_9AGAR|nr:hypothetical protein F5878DRAFT_666206 [Lentinula raphanica]